MESHIFESYYAHVLPDILYISLHILNQYGLVDVKLKLQSNACGLCNTIGCNLTNIVGVMSHLLLFNKIFWIQSYSL